MVVSTSGQNELPPFQTNGLLPVGDYPLTLDGLRACHLVTGKFSDSVTWDRAHRTYLVDQLEIMVVQLWQIGLDRIFIDGSFVENKDHPNDIDGYFECDVRLFVSGELERRLNALDPLKVWTWKASSRRHDPNSAKSQLPMWHAYHVELYPHYNQISGIRDRYGNDLQFPAAFRKSRSGDLPKGIIQIVR
jgi:hypothetical protein